LKLHIAIDGKRYEVEVELPEDAGPAGYAPSYLSPPRDYRPAPAPTVPAAAPPAAATSADESKVCRSPMAGVVIKVNAQPGQQIQINDVLIVLEAMKMETNVTAPASGKIKAVTVQPGDAVQLNQVVVELE
jgi:methylmalonyl-CoA carboxyltransferase small subunit